MMQRRSPQVSSRKQPQQARANDLVAAVLDAAVQVLRSEGAARFTTARVAERAGVSVGSLYQYFPNKAAILFRLQANEWRQTSAMLRSLEDRSHAPIGRLRRLTHAFLQSECDEAQVRVALDDAAPLYRAAPEAEEARAGGSQIIRRFIDEALPHADDATRSLAADLIETTLTAVGSAYSMVERTPEDVRRYADTLADMLCGYLIAIGADCAGNAWHKNG